MRKHKNRRLTVIIMLITVFAFSQERDKDTINTDVIHVVKPYTPTLSDAFKLKEVPSLDDAETNTKRDIKYNIFSFPVASTFTPAKGKAAVVDKAKQVKLFDNYATLGVGTYATVLGEVYLNHSIGRGESVGGYVSHHSSQGDLDGVLLDDGFSKSKINLNYSKRLSDLSWNVEAGFQHQFYNWYGLPQQLIPTVIDLATINSLSVGHSFYGFHVGGDLKFEDNFVKSGNVYFRRFGDDSDSGENRFNANAVIDIPISDEEISTTVKLDYLGGAFDRSYDTTEELKYGNFNIGLSPTYQLKQDDLTVDIGVSIYYLNDTEANKSKFYIYPNVTASYRIVSDVLIAYGGIQGDLIQNSYYDFAQENPFVSPTLLVVPTDQQYNAFIGLKGKLSNTMSYILRGNYIADRSKALFINNDIVSGPEDYMYGNSFGVVYDDVSTFGVSGEINVDINRNFKLGMKAEYFAYSIDVEDEAWNLPDIKGSLFMDYQIDAHWFAGANLFYVGERKDQFFQPSLITPSSPITITLDSFFDANAHVGYHINERFSAFIKANNIANQDYNRWQNYPVQSIQFLAGLTYKFDF